MRYKQYFCACSVTLLTTNLYMHVLWPSPTIPLLTSSKSPIGKQLTQEEVFWIGSIKSLGMLLGAIIAGILMDKVGLKKTLLFGGSLLLVSWIIIIFAMSFAMLIVGGIMAGFGFASVLGVSPIYIGEISEKHIRGRLNTIPSIGGAVAVIVMLGAGPYVPFITLSLLGSLVSLIFCITLTVMPESPYYLIKVNDLQAAYQTLSDLSKGADTNAWLKEIETNMHQDEECKLTVKDLIAKINYRKSLLIVLALKTLHQFSGIFAIAVYLQTIVNESQISISTETCSMILAAIQISCVLISAYLIDNLGRRSLLVISSAGCAIALIGEGIYFYLVQKHNVNFSSLNFLPTLFLILYLIMDSVGTENLLYVVTGELFATELKKVGGSMLAFYSGLLSFVGSVIFKLMWEACDMHIVFWIFGGVGILRMLFGLFILPETKGRSFKEIQSLLTGKSENHIVSSSINTTTC